MKFLIKLLMITVFFQISLCYVYAEPRTISLRDGLRIVTEEARLLRISRLNEGIARTDLSLASSRFFPSINAYVKETFLANQPGARFGPAQVYTSEKEFLSYGISLYQSIYDFGGDTSRYEASKSALSATQQDIRRIKNLVALEFINTYLELLEIERLIDVSKKEVESLEAHLKEATAHYEEGMITKNEKLEAEVRLSDAKQRLLSLENQRSLISSKLSSILLLPINQELKVLDVEPNFGEIPGLEEAWQEALQLRPEIKVIDHELDALRLQERAKSAEYYPRLFLQAGYEYTENRYLLHEENWSLIFGMNLNLFNGGSTTSEIERLRYRQRQLIEEKDRLIDDIRLEVKRYYIELKNALEKLDVALKALSQAEENLRINTIRFEEGVGRSTDVLDAIALSSLAEINYHRARYEVLRAEVGLNYSMGKELSSIYGR